MPTPVKWSAADFELANAENPEGEPWLSASPDGQFSLTYYESFTVPSAFTDIESQRYSAAGVALGVPYNVTASSTTIDHQPASAFSPIGLQLFVWTEEPTAGGGNFEDVHTNGSPNLVLGGAGAQLDPVVAANVNSLGGWAVAVDDGSVAGGQLVIKFYDAVGSLYTSVFAADAGNGVNSVSDSFRDVEITGLANGNYVVAWVDASFDVHARIFTEFGAAAGGVVDVTLSSDAVFPDVTALADGRFLVTYERYLFNTVLGRVYEADGAFSAGPFTISTTAVSLASQQVQTAALNDGRFVTIYLNLDGNIEGQMMNADGTPDGGTFIVNSDGAGDKSLPAVATLADGRFVVSWESGAGATTATIVSTIFDPREAGLFRSASSFDDDWYGTDFNDRVYLGLGDDRFQGDLGNDLVYGEAGNDTILGAEGADRFYGGNQNDTLDGGADNDNIFGELGNDILTGSSGDDNLRGDAGNDQLFGGLGIDDARGGAGDDQVSGEDGDDKRLAGDTGNDTVSGGIGDDRIDGGQDNDTLNGDNGSDFITAGIGDDTVNGGFGDDGGGLGILRGENGNDTISGGDGIDRLEGGNNNDRLIGGLGNDTHLGGTGNDVFVFADDTEGNDRIDDWVAANDQLEIDASNFGGGLAAGALAANRLVVGAAPVADQAFGQFLYRTTNGQLSWDADGTGAGAAVNLTRLLNGGVAVGTLVVADFDIVA